MEFDIEPSIFVEDGGISLPQTLRQDLGVLVGQFLQIKSGEVELVLQILAPLSTEQECAHISISQYPKIKKDTSEYKILEVTLGCDPEFFILWNNKRVVAATYLPFVGQIGCDGELGELRPTYGRHENQVVATLASLIPQIPSKMKREMWAHGYPERGDQFSYEAHSYLGGVAAGFHVHMGIPPEILNTRRDFNRAAMNHIVQCLDWYVSVPLVPLEADHSRRLGQSNYGRPGDYRPSNVTLEYRTPGGFYLRTPTLAAGLMGMSLLVVENLVSRLKIASKNFVNLHKLTGADFHEIMPKPESDKIRSVLLSEDVNLSRYAMDGIRKQLESLPSFGKHRKAVEDFFSVVDEKEQPGPNLLVNWKEEQ
jgi:hypothetical protein